MVKLSSLGTITQVSGLGQHEKRHQSSPPSFPSVLLDASSLASNLQKTGQSIFVEGALKERQDMHIGGLQNRPDGFSQVYDLNPKLQSCKQDKSCCYCETQKASSRIKH